jgi:hypothetical protein
VHTGAAPQPAQIACLLLAFRIVWHALNHPAQNVHIPLEHLLSKRQHVEPDGTYVRHGKGGSNDKAHYLTMMQARAGMCGIAGTDRVRHSVAIYGRRLLFCDQSMREKAWRSRKRGA